TGSSNGATCSECCAYRLTRSIIPISITGQPSLAFRICWNTLAPRHHSPPEGFVDGTTLTPAQLARGRLLVLLAAVLWSLSGFFTRVLTKPTLLGFDTPPVEPLQIACARSLFAALVMLPMLRGQRLSFRPLMIAMMLCFALMNVTFVSAQALGA